MVGDAPAGSGTRFKVRSAAPPKGGARDTRPAPARPSTLRPGALRPEPEELTQTRDPPTPRLAPSAGIAGCARPVGGRQQVGGGLCWMRGPGAGVRVGGGGGQEFLL